MMTLLAIIHYEAPVYEYVGKEINSIGNLLFF
jgi:hypothetical protein